MEPPSDHYSYTVYADAAKAATFDADRFGGPIGRLLAQTQDATVEAFVGSASGRTVLDVGTGTGRAALALARRGAVVTGVDASAAMLAVAASRARDEGVAITFRQEDVHALSFPDRSFDVVVCLRVLMHTPDWRLALAELCRVSRGQVLLDYPALASAAAVQAGWRAISARWDRRVEAYRVFTERALRRELRRQGFRLARTRRQFVLPIAVHKLVGSPAFTRATEGLLAAVGLRWLCGSPVTLVAERCES